jgi:hypothetical protein
VTTLSRDRSVIVVCANPCITLTDDAGTATAFASIWRVDWSPHGRGTALIAWLEGRVHVYGENVELASWLERDFVRRAGRPLPGEIVLSGTPERPGSAAFVTDAEVWLG